MSRRGLRTLLPFAALVALPLVARADAIMGPPAGCPVGSVGVSSHSGTWCAPADCGSEQLCENVMRSWTTGPPAAHPVRYACRAGAGVCVRSSEVPQGGNGAQGSMATKREALSTCASNADCPSDAPCDLGMHCVADAAYVGPSSEPSPASPASRTFWQRAFSCEDDIAPTHRVGGIFLGMGGLGLAAVLARRRRR